MAKSLGNVIGIFDDEAVIRKQIFGCFTDPNRIKPTDPGIVEGNPIFIYHHLLNEDKDEVRDLENRYREGKVGDVEVKEKLIQAHLRYFKEERDRYTELKANPILIDEILQKGKAEASLIAKDTIKRVRKAIGIDF
jgi:tryptophanyl-tRNA synthetase